MNSRRKKTFIFLSFGYVFDINNGFGQTTAMIPYMYVCILHTSSPTGCKTMMMSTTTMMMINYLLNSMLIQFIRFINIYIAYNIIIKYQSISLRFERKQSNRAYPNNSFEYSYQSLYMFIYKPDSVNGSTQQNCAQW